MHVREYHSVRPLIDNAELVPSILMDVSERTRKALENKFLAMLDSKQDR